MLGEKKLSFLFAIIDGENKSNIHDVYDNLDLTIELLLFHQQ